MKTKTIKQVVIFKANSHDIYEVLMDSDKHSRFTGDKADISREVGGRFTAFGGYSDGVNVELVPDKKIVQTWRAGDWPKGHYSRVTFSLEEIESGTQLTFVQNGVPEEQHADISQGWQDYYWKPMTEMLKK